MGATPYAIVNRTQNIYEYITKIIKQRQVQVKFVNAPPKDYDVMFSESSGFASKWEKLILTSSKNIGKINIKVKNAISMQRNIRNINYLPEHTKHTLDGICVKENRSIIHYREFTNGLFLLNTGDPDWDWFITDDFKKQVHDTNEKYGEKFLLLGAGFINSEEIPYYRMLIAEAEVNGFNVAIRIHPGCERRKDAALHTYYDMDTDGFVLDAAASHVIENISSAMLAESLLLGTKVGCTPAIRHFLGYGVPHLWVSDYNKWHKNILPKVGKELLDIIPIISDRFELAKFLSDDKLPVSSEHIDKLFGWPKVPNYCSYFFESVEKQLGVVCK
jgi:hypothetical protein